MMRVEKGIWTEVDTRIEVPRLTEAQAAKFLGISVHWLRKDRLKAVNELAYIKFPGIRYEIPTLTAFKQNRIFKKPAH